MPKYSASFITSHIPSGIGIYYAYHDGRLELNYINDGYYNMLNTTKEERDGFFGEGMASAIHPDDLVRVQNNLTKAIKNNSQFNCEMRVLTGDNKTYKWLNVVANIVEKDEEKTVLFASYFDIDEQKKAKLELDATYKSMELASQGAGMNFWLYDIDRHIYKADYGFNKLLGYENYLENFPNCLLDNNLIHPDDVNVFMNFYSDIEKDVPQNSAVIRFYNINTKQYEWTKTAYSRLDKDESKTRIAVGYSNVLGQEVENQIRYQHEVELRKELEKESLAYFQLNLSKHTIEEYYSKLNDIKPETLPIAIDESIIRKLTINVLPEYHNLITSVFDASLLLDDYHNGITSREVEYQRKVHGDDVHWVSGDIEIMKRPSSEDIIAFISVRDKNEEKIKVEALDCILYEEIESVIVEEIKNRRVHIIMEKQSWANQSTGDIFIADEKFDDALLKNVAEEDKQACKEFIDLSTIEERLAKNDIIRITYRIKEADNKYHHKKVRIFYLNKQKDKIIIARRDITDLYEEELKQKSMLQEALNQANSANEAKSKFLSRVSHDMRTPLNVILSIAKLAGDERPAYDMMLSYFKTINEEGEFLLRLINDVLDMQKMENESIELKIEPVDYSNLLNSVFKQIQVLADEKNIDFIININGFIENAKTLSDPLRLQQLLVNLLSNAIKYTPRNGKVEFILENLSFNNNQAVDKIIIRDNGIGMSQEFMNNMYDPFVQENGGTTSTTRGTGLGLSIVKKIVELMGGEISCKSELGKGTEFTVILTNTLIIDDGDKVEKKIDLVFDDNKSLVGRRVLLCEDHPMNAMIVKKILKRKGIIVTHAENGKIGLDYFNNSTLFYYDAILMDIRMPVMDGIETSKAIRLLDRKDAKKVPIIAMTANALNEDKEECQKAGMNKHLAKPINADEVWETLYEFIDFKKEISKLKVIIVDDVAMNIDVISEAIQSKYDVLRASSGFEALELLKNNNDVVAVITDILMPIMDGIQLIKNIRENNQYDAIAILANSEYDNIVHEEEILEMGVDDFIYKPTNSSVILARLDNVLARRNNMNR